VSGAALALLLALSAGQWTTLGDDGALSPVPARPGARILGLDGRNPGALASPVADPRGTVTVTPARASTGTYLTSSSTLAGASANTLRSEPGGILVEPSSTNQATVSDAIDNAAWTKTASGAAVPVVTADQAVAPDGTTTADQVVFPAVTSLQYSIVGLSGFVWAGTSLTWSVWMRTVSGTGSIYLYVYDTTGASYLGNTLCSLTTTWSRCVLQIPTVVSGHTINTWIGNDRSAGSGMSDTAAVTIYAWRGQPEALPFPTSSIGTSGTAVTRAADTVAVAASVLSTTAGSGVMTVTPEWSSSTAGADRPILDTTGLQLLWVNGSTAWRAIIGGQTVTSGAQTFAAGAAQTLRWRYSTSGLACLSVNGTETCSGLAPSALVPSGNLYIGGNSSGGGGVNVAGLRLCSYYGVCR